MSDNIDRIDRRIARTVREHRHVMAPVCVRCALCGLNADDGHMGVHQIEIKYGGTEALDLAPLWRRHYVCEPCIAALASAP